MGWELFCKGCPWSRDGGGEGGVLADVWGESGRQRGQQWRRPRTEKASGAFLED